MAEDSLTPAIGSLLASIGRGAVSFRVEPLEAGGNNRVFSVISGDERYVAKWYFHDSADPRDRLGAEFQFLQHAWQSGLRCVPRPYARDSSAHLALYEFVAGAKPLSSAVDQAMVLEAAGFFATLNGETSRAQAAALPVASEACFSVAEHFGMVDQRIARLDSIPAESGIDAEARRFANDLAKVWSSTKSAILGRCADPVAVLPLAQRCLSPSDFGFHNSLVRNDRSLCFIDFEYAGWDDPAKAVGDFFAHPGVPVAHAYFEDFLERACAVFPDPALTAERARLLEPVFRVKWCCIILNEFLPAAAKRRRFADASADAAARKRLQLAKARTLLDTLTH